MASIFTFEPDPPRIASPWSTPPVSNTPRLKPVDAAISNDGGAVFFGGLPAPAPTPLEDCGTSKLEPEPQDGPTEYKLHLLLRPQQSISVANSASAVSGSYQAGQRAVRQAGAPPRQQQPDAIPKPAAAPTLHTRQNRLQHLTTQLLWRLQQSSPYHSSSTVDLVLPRLPEATPKLGVPLRPQKLLPGLEESKGALYEIGVADDGRIFGLTTDEMDESLINLRAMAASLGCNVEILRAVTVKSNRREREEGHADPPTATPISQQEKLWAVEALITPDTAGRPGHMPPVASPLVSAGSANGGANGATRRSRRSNSSSIIGGGLDGSAASRSEQLRVSLTGPTTCGKSSLLGTLSTATLDNGRGKSRLSLLKHRHEIASGVTSSVAPELIGYAVAGGGSRRSGGGGSGEVVNYESGNTSSWTDIHNAAEGGRLVYLVDSAGHTRYRRTAVRGLIAWAPHWALCCVSAVENDEGSKPSADISSSRSPLNGDALLIDLSIAHLELCLSLGLPLGVVITKYDLASLGQLKQRLGRVLSTVKAAGRTPVLLKPDQARSVSGFNTIRREDEEEVERALRNEHAVPIVLTSVVSGSGIPKLHALLKHLPISPPPSLSQPLSPDRPAAVLNIDEMFFKPLPEAPGADGKPNHAERVTVLGGHLVRGSIAIGEHVYVGPFPTSSDPSATATNATAATDASSPSHGAGTALSPPSSVPRARSLPSRSSPLLPRSLSGTSLVPPPSPTTVASPFTEPFVRARVVSARNLRMPVRRLLPDQIGTLGVAFDGLASERAAAAIGKLRKGMVVVSVLEGSQEDESGVNPSSSPSSPSLLLPAVALFKARFGEEDYEGMEPGGEVAIYTGSVRARAKVLVVESVGGDEDERFVVDERRKAREEGGGGGVFGFDAEDEEDEEIASEEEDEHGEEAHAARKRYIDVTFHLLTTREFIEAEAQVLVMPMQGMEGGTGFEGFVGRVTEIIS